MFNSREDLDRLLRTLDQYNGADVHLGPERPPVFRVAGDLTPVPEYPENLTSVDMEIILEHAFRNAMGPSAVQSLDDLDFSYIPGQRMDTTIDNRPSLYRVNAGMSSVGIRMVFRRLAAMPPTLSQVDAPQTFVEVLETQRQGLILVTGPTGSGKSTTLAAGIRHLIESNFSLHIITLENPIEYRYAALNMDKCYVTQRELQRSLKNFSTGMRSALRQDPDVILVGELRDLETMRLALEAAETGHLVLATVHTSDIPSTISRIVQAFPTSEQTAARVQLLSSLRYVVTQRLLPSIGPTKRVAARETLVFTPESRQLLLEMDPAEVYNKLGEEVEQRGVSMMAAVDKLYTRGLLSQEEHRKMELELQSADDRPSRPMYIRRDQEETSGNTNQSDSLGQESSADASWLPDPDELLRNTVQMPYVETTEKNEPLDDLLGHLTDAAAASPSEEDTPKAARRIKLTQLPGS